MTDALLERLRCPSCGSSLIRGTERPAEPALTCTGCTRAYPIIDGVPWMASVSGVAEDVAKSFGFQWRARASKLFERSTLYGLSPEEEHRNFFDALGIQPDHVTGRSVLDAGCGDGFLLAMLAEYPTDVVGIDINTSIQVTYRRCRDLTNVTVLQADIFAAPFAAESFDYVWCEGVLTHTEDARRGFRSLSALVKPGGRLYVWVYPSERLSVYQRIRDLVRVAHKIPPPLTLLLCYGLALPLVVTRRLLGRRGRGESLRAVAFALFDNLSPRVQSRHTVAEVRTWFEENGFTDLKHTGFVGVSGTKGHSTLPPTGLTPAAASRPSGGPDRSRHPIAHAPR